MKTVIVEDEIRIREGIFKLVRKISLEEDEILCAENGKEGLHLIQEFKPDLIITDIRMPEMDGLTMLSALSRKGELPKTIILSAYSEFDYARKALQLGVMDYILKPISIVEFTNLFKKSRQAIEVEKEREGEDIQKESLDMILNNMLHSDFIPNATVKKKIEENYGLREESKSSLLLIYVGNQFEEKKQEFATKLKKLWEGGTQAESYIWFLERERIIGILLYNYDNFAVLERWLQRQNMSGFENTITENLCAGIIELNELEALKVKYETLEKNLKWNITLGKGVLVSYPKVENIHTVPVIYPISLEQDIREYVCTMDSENTEKTGKKFIRYFQTGEFYAPQEIQKSFVKFIWSILNVIRETDGECYEAFDSQIILERLMQARTFEELEQVQKEVIQMLLKRWKKSEGDSNLLVKRVKGYVHEFYTQGITLNEIAATFGITPEYLGTQFHKETGMTYSNYLKEYRIEKAKKLLLGTDLKNYEIAASVGYSDPKYFSKVFKEMQGELPGDFRKRLKV